MRTFAIFALAGIMYVPLAVHAQPPQTQPDEVVGTSCDITATTQTLAPGVTCQVEEVVNNSQVGGDFELTEAGATNASNTVNGVYTQPDSGAMRAVAYVGRDSAGQNSVPGLTRAGEFQAVVGAYNPSGQKAASIETGGEFLINGNDLDQNLGVFYKCHATSPIFAPGTTHYPCDDDIYLFGDEMTHHWLRAQNVGGVNVLDLGGEANNYASGFAGNVIVAGGPGGLTPDSVTNYPGLTIGGQGTGAYLGMNGSSGHLLQVTADSKNVALNADQGQFIDGQVSGVTEMALSTNGLAAPVGLQIPGSAGLPSQVRAGPTGTVPIVYDTSSNRLCAYNGSWKCSTFQ